MVGVFNTGLLGFDSGEPSLDDLLNHRAARNQVNGSSHTYVACDRASAIGYYCLPAGAISHAEAPTAMNRNRPGPIPVLVLGRPAIYNDHHQTGLGTALLRDAVLQAFRAAEIAGVTALLCRPDPSGVLTAFLADLGPFPEGKGLDGPTPNHWLRPRFKSNETCNSYGCGHPRPRGPGTAGCWTRVRNRATARRLS